MRFLHLYLAPPLGWPHWDFAEVFGSKNYSLWAIVWRCSLDPISLAIFVEYRLVRNGQADMQMDGQTGSQHIYRTSIASRGENGR